MLVLESNLVKVIACLFAILAVGSLGRFFMLWGRTDDRSGERFKSLRSWWMLATLVSCAMLLGELGILSLLAVASILSMWEYLRILGWNAVGRATSSLVFGMVLVYYGLLMCGYSEGTRAAAPVAILIGVGAWRAALGLTEGFIRTTAATIWGVLLFVHCLSHAYFLLTLPGLPEPWAGNVGWFLYLVLLTETNDIAQALVGRTFGRTKIAPKTSPNKTWEGLLGGLVVTTLLAIVLAPWLTSFMQPSWSVGGMLSAASGLLISSAGFFGDINKSGIKRDVGIKDSGTIIPGQGGMIDRIDSLTFSGPVFYYFLALVLFLS